MPPVRSRSLSTPGGHDFDPTPWSTTFPPRHGILGLFGAESRTREDCAPLNGILRSPGHYMRAHRFYSPFPIMTAQLNAFYSICAMETYMDELQHRTTLEGLSVGELVQYVRYAQISM